ncbi:diguanylate cyclase [Zoogloea sp.]|jgi:diguanylate cyclase (GGDEF)-like protein/PAS domain S-box-containing protein|uniref:sensor domain-containing diguanylate cyclase n=1 Tax=Zoogloea sp. TaxID=49181 RepID=UPI0035AFB2CF
MTAPAEPPPGRPSLAPDARPPEARAVLDGLLEHLLNGVAYCRMEYTDGQPSDFLFLYTNPAFHSQTGLADVCGKHISQIVPGLRQTDPALLEIFGRVARGGQPETFVMPVKSMAEWFSVSVYCPHPEHFIALFDVVTERKKAEAALEDRARQLRFVLEGSELGFWDWDIATGKVERNPQWGHMLGYTFEELQHTAQQWADFVHPHDRERAWASIFDVVEGRSAAHKLEYRMLHKDGSIRWILDQAKVMQRDGHGKATRMCGTHTDITERKLLEEELRRQAHVDYLTGIYNRRHFMERAEQELSRAHRYAKPLSMLMLDIDHFKQINDRHGHKVGDTVLKAVADLSQATFRDVDIVGRLGGEEFAALLPETDQPAALEAAERLRATIANARIPLPGAPPVSFSVSIGVSSMDSPEDNIDALLQRADKALYKAKDSGRNRVCGRDGKA